jgi:hypothetical protein
MKDAIMDNIMVVKDHAHEKISKVVGHFRYMREVGAVSPLQNQAIY